MPPRTQRAESRHQEPALSPWKKTLAVLSLAFVATYVAIATARMAYPFELEWIEGGLLQSTLRVLHGQPLYARPTLEYVAFNYPPLYPWVAALAARFLGETFLPLRLVSFLASLGCFAVVAGLVWRETGDRFSAWFAVGLFAATFRLCGAWFDVARADSLYLMLLLGAFAVLRLDAARVRSTVLSGALFSLAFLAKQSALMVMLPLFAYLLLRDRVRFLVLATTTAATIGGGTLWLDHHFGGWYRYFLFYVPSHHPLEAAGIFNFWPRDIAMPMGLALAMASAFLGFAGRVAGESALGAAGRGGGNPTSALGRSAGVSPRGFYAAMLAGTMISSWYHRMYPGGYDNVLMPAYASIALLAGLGWHHAACRLGALDRRVGQPVASTLGIAGILQFMALAYDPFAQIPKPADRAMGERFVQQIRSTPRPLIPAHPYLARLAGKPDSFHEMAFVAVAQFGHGEAEQQLVKELEDAVRDTTFSLVVLDSRGWLGSTIRLGYEEKLAALPDPDVFWPVTGMRIRPEYVFLPRRGAAAEPAKTPSPAGP